MWEEWQQKAAEGLMHQVLLWVSAAPFLQAGCLELSAVHWYSCVLESFYSVLPHTHTNSCYSSFRIINPILCCCSDLGTSSLGTCTSSLGTSSVLVTFSWNTHLKPQLLRSKTLAWNLHIICGDSTYLASSLEDHMMSPTLEGTKPSSWGRHWSKNCRGRNQIRGVVLQTQPSNKQGVRLAINRINRYLCPFVRTE